MTKKDARLRRAKKTRMRIREQGVPRLTVHRSSQHIYAQVVLDKPGFSSQVLASASSLEETMSKETGTKTQKATQVGTLVAKRAKEAGIHKVAFDRSGFKYHGRVKALADAARGDLEF